MPPALPSAFHGLPVSGYKFLVLPTVFPFPSRLPFPGLQFPKQRSGKCSGSVHPSTGHRTCTRHATHHQKWASSVEMGLHSQHLTQLPRSRSNLNRISDEMHCTTCNTARPKFIRHRLPSRSACTLHVSVFGRLSTDDNWCPAYNPEKAGFLLAAGGGGGGISGNTERLLTAIGDWRLQWQLTSHQRGLGLNRRWWAGHCRRSAGNQHQ